MTSPLVSVVLPTFNRLPFLRIAVQSVLDQTYGNWELVIADDGSSRETLRYLEDLADPRIRLVRLPHSGNPSSVRNAALREARGAYVGFLDSDDAWLAAKVEVQIATMQARPRCRWSYTAVEHIDGDGKAAQHLQGTSWVPHEGRIIESLLNVDAYVATPTVVAERSLIEEVGGFDEQLRFAEDYDLWFRLASRSEVALVNQRLTQVRRHPANYSHDRRGFYQGWVDFYGKAMAATTDPRLRSICRRNRANLSLDLARLHGRARNWTGLWRTLAEESRRSWADADWWLGILRAGLRSTVPHGLGVRSKGSDRS